MKNIPWKTIVARFRGELLPAQEERRLSEWLTDAAHRNRYEELQNIWNSIRLESEKIEPDLEKNWKKLHSRIAPSSTLARRRLPAALRYAAAACIAAVLLFTGSLLHRPEESVHSHTNFNGKCSLTLPDGSVVWLHRDTKLRYGGEFGRKERAVELDGEAYFIVAHGRETPFIVRSEGVEVTAHGTQFNVNSQSGVRQVRVGLAEGSVSVRNGRNDLFLIPGQMAECDPEEGSIRVVEQDIALLNCWAGDQLVFHDKPLGEICDHLSIWYGVDIEVDVDLAQKYKYTFTLRDETLEEVMRIMAQINPLSYDFPEKNRLDIMPK